MADGKRETSEREQLTAKDLALYLGCYFMDLSGENKNDPERIYLLNPQALTDITHFVSDLGYIKPILRRPSEMPKKENDEYSALACIEYANGLRIEADSPRSFKYLLDHHFDVFGWIDAGLAIDATSLETNPYNKA